MIIKEDQDLKSFNTFGLSSKARFLVEVASAQDFQNLIQKPVFKENKTLLLGGGSNILLTRDFDGLVVVNKILGKEVLDENDENILVKYGAGEVWHEVVMDALDNGWCGIENLSLIPGTIGAAPMQNIGAYGVEIKEVFESLEAVSLETGTIDTFDKASCEFGYRESVFKRSLKHKYFITSVTLKLKKTHTLNTSYGAISDTLAEMNVAHPSAKDVSNAVIKIRQSKLPDPKEIGNSGSFFKNPVVGEDVYLKIKKNYPYAPGYPQNDGSVKVPAGWLIETCGWKGKRRGSIGVHSKQALVLVNHGGGKGEELLALANDIIDSVENKFGIRLSPEVNII